MITLIGDKLKQWDLNRKVQLIPREGTTIEKVTFIRGNVTLQTPIASDMTAEIPNVFLKSFGGITIKCEGFDEYGHEVEEKINFHIYDRTKPDDYVYVETKTSSGGVSSWNDLMDRPFEEETVTKEYSINFPTSANGFESVSWRGFTWVKVADGSYTIDDLNGGSVVMTVDSGEEVNLIIGEYWRWYVCEEGSLWWLNAAVAVCTQNVESNGANFTPGIWFKCPAPDGYVRVCFSRNETEIKTLDEKYLPESVKGGGSGDSNMFVVTMTTDTESGGIHADKSKEEIFEAVKNGLFVYAKMLISFEDGSAIMYAHLTPATNLLGELQIQFYSITVSDSDISISVLTVNDDKTVQGDNYTLAITPM